MLTVKNERAGDIAIIKCAGRIVRGQESPLRNAVLAEKCNRIIVLDLSDVEALDAGGFAFLVSFHPKTESNRIHMKPVNPRPFLPQTLTRTHLYCIVDISSLNHTLTVLGGCEH